MEAAFECNCVSVKRESVSVEVSLNMFLLLVKKRKFKEQTSFPQRLCRCQEKPSFRTLGAA